MTLTIEVPPDVQSALEAKAARLGMPLERYAAGVLQRDVESNGDTRVNAERDHSQSEEHPNPIARALALRDELAPSIRAGTRRADTPLNAVADLAALREERFADAS